MGKSGFVKCLLMIALITSCACPNPMRREHVDPLCESHGGIYALYFTKKKSVKCVDGSWFKVKYVRE